MKQSAKSGFPCLTHDADGHARNCGFLLISHRLPFLGTEFSAYSQDEPQKNQCPMAFISRDFLISD